MTKDIYELLGFKKGGELIFSTAVIHEAKDIFDHLPLRNIGIRPLIVEQTVLEETLAISTAEDSELTLEEAKKIQISEEQATRLLKYEADKKLTASEKYDALEFENIRAVENIISDISFKELTVKLICEMHHDLTVGLDGYAKPKGISSYHSGELRSTDNIKVGKLRKYGPPRHNEVPKLLELLLKDFSGRKKIELYDILEFHILLYAIHPFRNGNKRVARILESMLLAHYGYSAERTLSLSIYYTERKDACNLFLMESLIKRKVSPFINFAVRGYFYAGARLFKKVSEMYLQNFLDNFKRYTEQNVKKLSVENYKKAGTAIVELKGVFTHTEFVEQMKKHHCTLGVSQTIIQALLAGKILKKEGNLYYYEKSLEIKRALEKLTSFLLRYSIDLSGF